jgi:hypothetical protein
MGAGHYKSATYDKHGNLLSFDIYLKLDFDNDGREFSNNERKTIVTLKSLEKKFGNMQFNDFKGVEDLCGLIMKEQAGKQRW